MAELDKNKSKNNQLKLIFDWKQSTIFKQLFISAPKFPKTVANTSFLQCSAYIILGRDDGLGKINLKILWNHRARRIR